MEVNEQMDAQANFPSWIAERKKWHNEHMQPEYFSIPEGETSIELNLSKAPQEREGTFGKQFVYHITANNKDYLLSASLVLDRLIISALSEGINPMTIIRTGTKKQTRYNIKELAKKKR
jgi:hypothetical protein